MLTIRIHAQSEPYHPTDSLFDSWTEKEEKNSRCSGYDNFKKEYPDFPAFLKTRVPLTSMKNEEAYKAYFASRNIPVPPLIGGGEVQIETIPAPVLGCVCLAWAEELFLLLAEQAKRGINTRNAEETLLKQKAAIELLSRYQGCVVAPIPETEVHNFDEKTPLSVLESYSSDVKQYVGLVDGGSVGLIGLTLGDWIPKKIFIIVPPKRIQKSIQLGYDGKNFIAVYPDEIAALGLPASVAAQLPAAPVSPLPAPTPDPDIEERTHGDVLEHKHDGYEYWHPASRVHPKEEGKQ